MKSLDRISAFRNGLRSNVEQVRIKAEMPYFYEIYEAIKKVTANDSEKISAEQISSFLEERGKLIIGRAIGIFE